MRTDVKAPVAAPPAEVKGIEFPLSPSDIVHSRYEILRGLDSGATGYVYLVKDLNFPGGAVEWVMKEIDPGRIPQLERQEAVELFSRECTLLTGLNHPSIPKLIESFQEGDRLFLVMEHIQGEDLESMVRKTGKPLPVTRLIEIAGELIEILVYLHSQSPRAVIFRDLKPSNIMITDKGKVRLIDFGISRFHRPEKERDTFVYGTVGFSPPEQYGAGQTDERSDIYALGATLYYLLTLEDPESFNFDFPPAGRINRNIPPMLEGIIMKCLRRAPGDRYQSSRALIDDMEALRENAGVFDSSYGSDICDAIIVAHIVRIRKGI